ncbi:MAG: ABC transporter permease [Ferruginibacter sp.]|nr:ABC transporter permease [Bacteroidota bacterium]MBX2919997.1 ABC transporter permease [Ferruginibacter sp.]MCB0710101.1 ABC transporter permease [Chitinophagaceae bacterium]
MQQYSQVKAMLAITKASLKAIFRSPSAVAFSFVFPFVFILVFGFIGNNGRAPVFKIVIDKSSDTANAFYDSLKASSNIKIVSFANNDELHDNIIKGKIAGILKISKSQSSNHEYSYTLKSSNASGDKWPQLLPVLNAIANKISDVKYENRPTYAVADFNYQRDIETVREYKTIDFILPGQLGFSLLSSGVFGVAFMFFNLRNTLVLKRFFATPISRTYIVLGEALSRVLFQLLTAIVIIIAGRYLFGFTLVKGFVTVINMMVLSFIGLLVFMGLGFIVSGLAKNESTIPPFANLLTLPQFLLGGTFFSVDVFPKWLQPISNAMPLTHLNTALRSVAFEGQNLWQVRTEIGILLLWGIAVYFVAIKVFKWE